MGGWPDGRPGPSVPSRVALALALAAGLLAGAAGAQDCAAPDLAVTAAEAGGIAITLRAPCAPYVEVMLGLGALEIVEETGIDGSLDVMLPAVPGAGEVTARLGERTLRAPVPSGLAPAPFIAIIWPEAGPWGRLDAGDLPVRRLGFPRPGAHPAVDLAAWPGSAAPRLRIDVTVTDTACGRRLTAGVVSAAHPELRTLSLDLPACTAIGQRVAIPLAP